jgi:transcriptional regulator CtsR
MLDAKINNEQEMEIVEEDAAAMALRRAQNKEDIVRAQIKQSQLKKANETTA